LPSIFVGPITTKEQIVAKFVSTNGVVAIRRPESGALPSFPVQKI